MFSVLSVMCYLGLLYGVSRGKEFPSQYFCKENKNTKKVLKQCFGAGRGSIIHRVLQRVLEPKPLFLLKLCNKDGKCRRRHKEVEGDNKRMEKALLQENALTYLLHGAESFLRS